MSFTRCSTHQRNTHATRSGHCATCQRIAVEGKIMRHTIRALHKAGYELALNDGEETTVKRGGSETALMAAAFTTDEDYLLVWTKDTPKSAGPAGWIMFIYGNDGHDVISDYTTNLEHVMEGVNDYTDTFEKA